MTMITVLGEHTLELDGQNIALVEIRNETTGEVHFVTKHPVTRDLFAAVGEDENTEARMSVQHEEWYFNLATVQASIDEVARQDPILSHLQYDGRVEHLLSRVREETGLKVSLLPENLLREMFRSERLQGNELVLHDCIAFADNRLPFRVSQATANVCGVLFVPCNIPVLVRKS